MFLKMSLLLWPSSLLCLLQLPLSLLNRSSIIAGIAAAVVGIAWQLSGQHLNVGQPPLYSAPDSIYLFFFSWVLFRPLDQVVGWVRGGLVSSSSQVAMPRT